MSDENRPFREMAREWSECQDNETIRESGISLCAIIEAMDAQTAAIQQLDKAIEAHSRTLSYDLKGVKMAMGS